MNQPPASDATDPNYLLGAIGALAGAVTGWFAFFWVARQGLYMLALPGGLLGAGAAWLIRCRSIPFAVACGIAALFLGVVVEWRFSPFIKDDGFGYFLSHLADLKPATLLFLAAGGFIGFWLPFRTRRN